MPIGQATAVIIGERIMDAVLMLSAAPFALYLFRSMLSDSRLDDSIRRIPFSS